MADRTMPDSCLASNKSRASQFVLLTDIRSGLIDAPIPGENVVVTGDSPGLEVPVIT